MNTFRKHDRLRVTDATPLKFFNMDIAPSGLKLGNIVTVSEVDEAGRRIKFEGSDSWWGSGRRFEFVERAVAQDKDGKPVYVGDVIRRDGFIYDYTVLDYQGTTHIRGEGVDGRIVAIPRKHARLVAHHWDIEAKDPLTEAVAAFGKTWEDYQKVERDRAAAAVESLGKALRKVVDAARVPETLSGPVFKNNTIGYDPKLDVATNANDPGEPVIGYDPATGHMVLGRWLSGDVLQVEPHPSKVSSEWLRDWAGVGPSWDKVRADMQVRVLVEATGEIFTATVTKGEPAATGLRVHGIPTTHKVVRNEWRLLSLSPTKPTAEGSILAPLNRRDRSRAFLVDGEWWYDPAGPKGVYPQKAGFANEPTEWRVIWDAGTDSPLTGKETWHG